MKQHNVKLRTYAIIAYVSAAILFLLFFIYIGFFEDISVYETREHRDHSAVSDYSMESVDDEDAPAGIRHIYRFTIENADRGDNCLSFYIVHSYAEVYFDGDPVYGITASENNRICKSIGSNWVTIPLYPDDSGKDVTVIITPVYKNVIDREVEFLVGSQYDIFFQCFKNDYLEVLLSVICIMIGIIVIALQTYLLIKKTNFSMDIFFLGNFSILLGIWRITDTRSSTLLFPVNPMMLGYVTIGVLCLSIIPLLLFMNEALSDSNRSPMLYLSLAATGVVLIILACQIFGIAEFKETLFLCHASMIVAMAAILIIVLIRIVKKKDVQSQSSLKYTFILAVGAILDIANFYIRGNSAGIIYTVVAFIIYTLILFAGSVMAIRTTAYTDSHTGLFNRARWDELMRKEFPYTGAVGMIMLDLNRLKYVNDTMGHEAGDRMIFDFANILHNILPPNSVICRWGGDEFTVMLTDVTNEIIEQYINAIRAAVSEYNQSGNTPLIYFAAGFALSTEFPDLGKEELLEEADKRMYQDKNKWYSENLRSVR